jgi:cytochrome c2
MFFAVLAITPGSAGAQQGDASAGHAFASEACKSCHVVDSEKNQLEF